VKNRLSKSVILGVFSAIAASASYALIAPSKTEFKADSAFYLHIKPIIDEIAVEKPIKPRPLQQDYVIQSGESLSGIFSKLNLSKAALYQIIADKNGKQFANITAGKILKIKIDKQGNLEKLSYQRKFYETLVATKKIDSNQYIVEKITKPIEHIETITSVTIKNSLFVDGKRAGLSDKMIMEIIGIFKWDIDFALNTKRGDTFSVVYDKPTVNGMGVGGNTLLSVQYTNRGKTFTAIRHEDKKGRVEYYTPKGNSLQKAFLQTPLDVIKVSSRFNLKRKHPILNRIRAHKGVDYSARSGTPVKTAGNGIVTFKGKKGGYGNVLIIQHGKKYSTLYAHLSKFKKNLKKGSKVKQGQVIAYVGQTGLATGPHLHYEFLNNGIHQNPLTAPQTYSKPPVPRASLAKFKKQSKSLMAKMDQSSSTMVAQK